MPTTEETATALVEFAGWLPRAAETLLFLHNQNTHLLDQLNRAVQEANRLTTENESVKRDSKNVYAEMKAVLDQLDGTNQRAESAEARVRELEEVVRDRIQKLAEYDAHPDVIAAKKKNLEEKRDAIVAELKTLGKV